MMLVRGHQPVASNEDMVQELEDSSTLQVPQCIAAFRAVDRQHFWVRGGADPTYADMPLRHGRLHQSAPHIYARALEALLPLEPGMSFLNVGSGTGYFSSIVSELCGADAISDGIDIWPENVAHARECCRQIGKEHITFTEGNVYQLDVEQGMRYDRIYLGACANAKSKYLYRLLEVGGILVGPFQAGHMQQLRRVVRRTESHFAVEVLNSVQFTSLLLPTPDAPASVSQLVPFASTTRSLGLPGVPFTFALRELPWAPQRNLAYPASFRQAARILLTSQPCKPSTITLPPEIWAEHVLPWCSRMWFEVQAQPPPRMPTKIRIVLSFVGDAAKKAFFRKRSGSDSITDSDADSDGGRTRASSFSESPNSTHSRTSSDLSFGSISSDSFSPPFSDRGLTLYEALGDSRPPHAIGGMSDPDEMDDDEPTNLLGSLLEINLRTSLAQQARAAAAAAQLPLRLRWCLAPFQAIRAPFRAIRRCLGMCRFMDRNRITSREGSLRSESAIPR